VGCWVDDYQKKKNFFIYFVHISVHFFSLFFCNYNNNDNLPPKDSTYLLKPKENLLRIGYIYLIRISTYKSRTDFIFLRTQKVVQHLSVYYLISRLYHDRFVLDQMTPFKVIGWLSVIFELYCVFFVFFSFLFLYYFFLVSYKQMGRKCIMYCKEMKRYWFILL
jgi:hypothetical protein